MSAASRIKRAVSARRGRASLDNHRDQLLSFAEKLDADLATRFQVSPETLRELLRLQHLSSANSRRWQREAELHHQLRDRFHEISEAVREVAGRTVRASSLVENLNSRLRNYFALRRHLGADYLALLQFFLHHRRFDRSECPDRVGKSPAELLSGEGRPHWLAMLGYQPFSQISTAAKRSPNSLPKREPAQGAHKSPLLPKKRRF